MPTLYTTALSANGRKPLAVARHLGLNVEVREVNVYRGDGRAPEYLALNPHGKVPTLVDGDLVLWESNAICVYLAQLAGDATLWPSTARAQADALRWLFWESAHWQPVLSRVLAERVGQLLFRSGESPAHVAWNDRLLLQSCDVLSTRLTHAPYLGGSAPNVADFCVAGMTTYFTAVGFPRDAHPIVAAWLDRMGASPAWRDSCVAPWRT